MTAICVDDEPLVLQLSLSLIRELPQFEQVEGFGGSVEALDWLETHRPDLALLDIDMPAINGISLAIRIKEQYPDTGLCPACFRVSYEADQQGKARRRGGLCPERKTCAALLPHPGTDFRQF